MARCRHARRGIVTNQDPRQPFDRNRPHASITSCDRDECISASLYWVAGQTNEVAEFYRDGWQASR